MLSLLLLLPALVAAAPAPRLHAARTLLSGRSIQENELVSRADASIPPEYLLKAALGSLSGNELLTSVTFATSSNSKTAGTLVAGTAGQKLGLTDSDSFSLLNGTSFANYSLPHVDGATEVCTYFFLQNGEVEVHVPVLERESFELTTFLATVKISFSDMLAMTCFFIHDLDIQTSGSPVVTGGSDLTSSAAAPQSSSNSHWSASAASSTSRASLSHSSAQGSPSTTASSSSRGHSTSYSSTTTGGHAISTVPSTSVPLPSTSADLSPASSSSDAPGSVTASSWESVTSASTSEAPNYSTASGSVSLTSASASPSETISSSASTFTDAPTSNDSTAPSSSTTSTGPTESGTANDSATSSSRSTSTESTESTTPTGPVTPSSSSTATEPTESTTPTGSVAPTSSTTPAESTESTTPTGSVAPTSSTTPTESTESATPTESATSTISSSAPNSTIPTLTEPLAAYQTNTTFNGQTFISKGLVGFGAIAGDAVDSQGETIGGIGSAIRLESLTRVNSTTYTGRMIVQPDRGWNRVSTVNYIARQHAIDFTLTPYYNSTNLEYQAAKSSFDLTYASTVLYKESDGTDTTGLDSLTYRNGSVPIPIPSVDFDRISTDAEGLVINPDGSFWMSDEYGPYIYKYSADGVLVTVIEPPAAFLPRLNGSLYFSANSDTAPTEGRSQNQGFEGLTSNAAGTKLYALLQSSLLQDAPASDDGRYTRLLAYDVSGDQPVLEHAYVVELPVTNGKSKTLGQSEFHYISDDTFVVLARDGKGGGSDTAEAKNKRFYLFTTSEATDIAGTTYTDDYTPVAPDNVLSSNLTAASVTPWVDILDDTQLARFGLYNGDTNSTFSVSMINTKWESIAFASCQDPDYPDDYFLFSFSDNDFITLSGEMAGSAYSDDEAGYTLDNQALVWRVTVPYSLQDA
ncbi:uncharacterized protein EHS24_008493 [Apiotrichum porosum]|uniref:Phytase-like domain-containing protein n=1 Tax=Apiotrichum porosum TaxID=105984 RepID=A0A427XQD3_9TREE|nr:uncharacterized protein EHS24_008493 [Apiotrichum porosum]RSH81059.1 hypothetical protein EHS24_008493 [Apiotrichum porosum]